MGARSEEAAGGDYSDEQILSHVAAGMVKENGGRVELQQLAFAVSSVADITPETASDVAKRSDAITVVRKTNLVITGATPVGERPPLVREKYGPVSQNSFSAMEVDEDVEDALESSNYDSPEDLEDAAPEAVAESLNEQLEKSDTSPPIGAPSILSESEVSGLEDAGYETLRDVVLAEPSALADVSATMTEAKATSLQNAAQDKVTVLTADDGRDIIDEAEECIPVGTHLAREALDRHRKRCHDGVPEARVTSVEAVTDTVGRPLADVRASIDPKDEKAQYVSDIGPNEPAPKKTGLLVLEDGGYEKIPRPETHPDAGPDALPVGPDNEVVPPAVPRDPELQMPVDEFVAKKLSRGLKPVREVGPRGSGKNYILKYICWATNRGYRSIDVDSATSPEDLFGPLSPDESGVIVPRSGPVKQGLLNGDVVVINEFPVMQAGAAISLHRLLNEGTLLIKSHGELIEPHPEARLVITMNPPTREYRDSEPMNSATRGRFRTVQVEYPSSVDDEVETLLSQTNGGGRQRVSEDTLRSVVKFAHRTRLDENQSWPTLSTRNLTIITEHIDDGVSPIGATKNVLRAVANQNEYPEDAFEALPDTF
jgi:nitric oxide reductase NorQ protein